MERTFSIIKPDAVKAGKAGAIIQHFVDGGLRPIAMKMVHMTRAEAEGFYAVHKARPFFGELVQFMTRSPVFISVLEREDAVAHYRKVMGATDPAKADAGTIRKLYGSNVGENAVHGSDSLENAKIEIAYFFRETEIQSYDWKK